MKKQILKRHGNYILRKRWIQNNNLYYRWYYSKELSNILKIYGQIEDWQFTNIECTLSQYTYGFNLIILGKIKFSFRNLFKATQQFSIKELIQYNNKVGKYAINR